MIARTMLILRTRLLPTRLFSPRSSLHSVSNHVSVRFLMKGNVYHKSELSVSKVRDEKEMLRCRVNGKRVKLVDAEVGRPFRSVLGL